MTEFTRNYFESMKQEMNAHTGCDDFSTLFSNGTCRLMKNYRDGEYYDYQISEYSDAFVVGDLPWESEATDFINSARDAGIEYIVITERSTALMDSIANFVKNENCTLVGISDVSYETVMETINTTTGMVLQI